MTYRVTAGFVTVETSVGVGRAHVDIPRGADVPADVPVEQVESLLRQGHIEAVEPVREPEPVKKTAAKKAVSPKSDN